MTDVSVMHWCVMATALFHLTTDDAWRAAQPGGEYRPASLSREGFIHLSTEAQWPLTARRFFAGQQGLVLLVIDAAKLVNVRFERADEDEFPHLYGPLPCTAVVEVRALPPP